MDMTNLSRQLSYSLLLIALVFLPIYRGGNAPLPIASLMMLMATVAALGLFRYEQHKNGEGGWLMVWLVVTLVVVLHIVVIPNISMLGSFLGRFEEIANTHGESTSIFRGLSVWAYFSAMWIAAWRASWLTRNQAAGVLLIFVLMSFFEASFGLYHLLSGKVSVLGLWDKEFGPNDVTGTFVNRNHLAGMLALCWPVALVTLLFNKNGNFRKLNKATKIILALFYSLVVLVALLTSHSRMGTAAGLFGLMIWAYLFSKAKAQATGNELPKWVIWIIGGLLLLVAVWFGIGDIVERFTQLENGRSRIVAWQAMFDLPVSVWLFGIGPGAFEDVFHLVQPNYIQTRFVHAHNDYLEFILEFGLLFSLVIVAAFIWWLRQLPRPNSGYLATGLLAAFSVCAIHSLVDFNLQIPAYGLYFSVLVGLYANANLSEKTVAPEHKHSSGEVSSSLPGNGRKMRKEKKPESFKKFWHSLIHPD